MVTILMRHPHSSRRRTGIALGLTVAVLLFTALGIALRYRTPSSEGQLVLAPAQRVLAVGATTSVTVMLRTRIPVATVAGSIVLPDEVSLLSLDPSRSLVELWTQKPTARSAKIISFRGGIANGFQGTGEVFTFVVRADTPGTAELLVLDPQLRTRKGKGGNIAVVSEPLILKIQRRESAAHPSEYIGTDNTTQEVAAYGRITAMGYVCVGYHLPAARALQSRRMQKHTPHTRFSQCQRGGAFL